MKGKKLSYIPAISVILVICGTLIAGLIYLCVKDISKTGKTYKDIDNLEKQKIRLEQDRANIKNTVNADQSYQEYFRQWENIEGEWTNSRVLSKISEIAEQSGVRVFESSVDEGSGAPSGFEEAPSAPSRPSRSPRGSRLSNRGPSSLGSSSRVGSSDSKNASINVVLLGEFPGLMNWISQMENSIGSVRFTKLVWTARSSEEVRLSVTVQYRKFR